MSSPLREVFELEARGFGGEKSFYANLNSLLFETNKAPTLLRRPLLGVKKKRSSTPWGRGRGQVDGTGEGPGRRSLQRGRPQSESGSLQSDRACWRNLGTFLFSWVPTGPYWTQLTVLAWDRGATPSGQREKSLCASSALHAHPPSFLPRLHSSPPSLPP